MFLLAVIYSCLEKFECFCTENMIFIREYSNLRVSLCYLLRKCFLEDPLLCLPICSAGHIFKKSSLTKNMTACNLCGKESFISLSLLLYYFLFSLLEPLEEIVS